MSKPLFNVRVADFSHVASGPFGTYQLALMGAEVTKIESPDGGDVMRYYGRDPSFGDTSAEFMGANCGKRSIAVDLKTGEGRAIALELVARSDVMVENFRPGVMQRLGLGYDACKALNPKLIYCSISGYGQSGALRDYPAYDHIIQAASGVMTINGEPGSPPLRVGFPIVDTFAGYVAAFAIMAALIQRQHSNEGQYIDVAMLDTSIVLMFAAVIPWIIGGRTQAKTGNRGYSQSPTSDIFAAKDGMVSVAGNTQKQFESLCRVIGRSDLIDDPRFIDLSTRINNEKSLQAEVSRALEQRSAKEWEALFNEAGVPAAAVRSIAEIMSHPHLADRELTITVPATVLGRDVAVLNAGFRFEHDGPEISTPAPRLGEHTDELLARLGYSKDAIENLRANAIVA